ncbi:MAG: hypothetical protein ACYTBJ_26995 [Planctomycetota bacterium]|jgi:hypothetical protein
MIWHGYLTVRQLNLGASNRDDLIALIDQIQTNGRRAEYQLTKRGNLAGTAYIYEARYNDGAVSFDKFADKLATAFDVNINSITINEVADDLGVIATYVHGGQDRFTIQLHGCATDDLLGTWQESNSDAKAMVMSEIGEWE